MPSMCPHCGWSNIRECIEPHIIDKLMRVLLLKPFRCRTCRQKFFWFAF